MTLSVGAAAALGAAAASLVCFALGVYCARFVQYYAPTTHAPRVGAPAPRVDEEAPREPPPPSAPRVREHLSDAARANLARASARAVLEQQQQQQQQPPSRLSCAARITIPRALNFRPTTTKKRA